MKCPDCLGSEDRHQLGCSRANGIDDPEWALAEWRRVKTRFYGWVLFLVALGALVFVIRAL